jgi:hypothetical protein
MVVRRMAKSDFYEDLHLQPKQRRITTTSYSAGNTGKVMQMKRSRVNKAQKDNRDTLSVD